MGYYEFEDHCRDAWKKGDYEYHYIDKSKDKVVGKKVFVTKTGKQI